MIRPLTFFCVVLAGTSGLYLYTEKHQTTVLDQKISKVVQDTQQIRERTSMLRAEWALLNQPDRLQSLATRFLPQLHPLDPGQFVQLASVEQRLPDVIQPQAPVAAAPADLAPVQVMARTTLPGTMPATLSDSGPATLSDTPGAALADQQADAAGAPTVPAGRVERPSHALREAAAAPVIPHRSLQHTHPVLLASNRPAPHAAIREARPAPRTAPMVQMASYAAPPLRRLIPNAGAMHPAPLPIAAWRPAQRYAANQPMRMQASTGFGSSLGFSHAALPPPVPVQDGN